MIFKIKTHSKKSKARLGELSLPHGKVQTPVFMPIGTLGSIKTLTNQDLKRLQTEIILGNTYHLWLRPGLEVLQAADGHHNFIHWSKPILTDSGGFQAWSLSKIRKFTEEGVFFRSHLDGSKKLLTPEISMQIQSIIGSDIALVLDQVVNAESDYKTAKLAMERTYRWAKRSRIAHQKILQKLKSSSSENNFNQLLFGIPQGAQYQDLREESAKLTMELDFPGYSVGGVAQGGEPEEVMYAQVLSQTEVLEESKPKHLLGVGTPKDIIEMVKRGIDMFDCVYPTRNARHGSILVWTDKDRLEYQTLKMHNQNFAKDFGPINPDSSLVELRTYSRAYLRHLFKAKEALAQRLATLNNLEFYFQLMQELRDRIAKGKI